MIRRSIRLVATLLICTACAPAPGGTGTPPQSAPVGFATNFPALDGRKSLSQPHPIVARGATELKSNPDGTIPAIDPFVN